MAEAPVPFFKKESQSIESELLTFSLDFNKNKYDFSLIDIDNCKIKIVTNKINTEENNTSKYEVILELDNLKNINKYFKMFDDYDEFKNDFIELCKKNIKINSIDNSEIVLTIDLMIKTNNILNITLKKVESNEKEIISTLLKDLKNKDEMINNLNSEIEKMKTKITSLEKNINDLNIKIKDLEKLEEIEEELNELKNKYSILEEKININEKEQEDELEFVNEDIILSKTEKEAKWIELSNITFKNLGNSTFSRIDLYFYKGEESSEEIYFVNNSDIKDKLYIELGGDFTPSSISSEYFVVLRIDEPILGKKYFCNIYIKSTENNIKMKRPLKISINIVKENLFGNWLNSVESTTVTSLICEFLDKKSKFKFFACSRHLISNLYIYLKGINDNIVKYNKISLNSLNEQIDEIKQLYTDNELKGKMPEFILSSSSEKSFNILNDDLYNNVFKKKEI